MAFSPYLVFALFLFLFSLFERFFESKRMFFLLITFACIFFFSLSDYLGSDWLNYYNYYNHYLSMDHQYGWIFNFFTSIFAFFDVDFGFYRGVLISTIFVLYLNLVRINDLSFSLSVFLLAALSPSFIFDTFRNSLAILLALHALPKINDVTGKIKYNGYFLILISCFVHISVILFFITPLLSKYYSRRTYRIFFIVVVFSIFNPLGFYFVGVVDFLFGLLDGFFNFDRYSGYTDLYDDYGLRLGVIEKIFVLVFFLFIMFHHFSVNLNPIYFNFSLLYVFFMVSFSDVAYIAQRISLLVLIPYIFVILHVFKYTFFKKLSIKKFFILPLLFSLSIKYFISYNQPLYFYSNAIFSGFHYEERAIIRDIHYE